MTNFQASRKLNLYLEHDVFVAYLSHLIPVKHLKKMGIFPNEEILIKNTAIISCNTGQDEGCVLDENVSHQY